MEISAGKLRGIRRIADSQGRFKMVAVDQRPPMLKALATKLPRAPRYEDLALLKSIITRHLAKRGSAILIDPDYGFSSAEPDIPPDRGLLVTLEDYRFEDTPGGRKTAILKGWSVEKIKRMGADGVKLLLWYRPDCSAEVIEHQKRLVRRVGDECSRYDIPFLLELLIYPGRGATEELREYTEDKHKRPDMVLRSLEDFALSDYGVDVFKIESPVAAETLPDPDDGQRTQLETQGWFRRIGQLMDRPWVVLSGGAAMEPFRRVVDFAYRSGASGYLAGRAIWWDAFCHYPDIEAMEATLESSSASYMGCLNAMTDSRARPWQATSLHEKPPSLALRGHDFPTHYPDMHVS
jgi:tagatose 1,6-diphosphate aldolase